VIVHDRYQNYDSAALGTLVHQLCTAHYPDLRVIPTWAGSVLVGGGVGAGLVGIILAS
jgi:hypothetical protein